MSYVERVVYAIQCDQCETSFTEQTACERGGHVHEVEVLLMHTDDGMDQLAVWMRSEGWVTVGGARHLCPSCGAYEQGAVFGRLVVEMTAGEPGGGRHGDPV